MRIKPRFLIGGGLIAAAVAYLIVAAITNTAEYYLTVNEAQARQNELHGQAVRIAGRVRPGTIRWDPATLTLSFAIGPIPDPDHEGVRPVGSSVEPEFAVVCTGQPKPDMFAEGRDVIVEGHLSAPNAVTADQVLTSCPSKYSARKKT